MTPRTPSESEHDDEREVIARLHDLHRSVVRWLGAVIMVAILGILLIATIDSTFVGDALRVGADTEGSFIGSRGTQTDQAVAILGNIASAGIGGLVGWVTRDFTLRYRGVRLTTPKEEEG